MGIVASEIIERGIIVIESLPSGEPQTGKDLFDSLLRWRDNKQNHYRVYYHSVKSANDFRLVISQITGQIKEGSVYTLHLETHGCEDGIGFTNGDLLPWRNFCEIIRPLNVKMYGLLLVVLAMCTGAGVICGVDLSNRAPFKAFIGATRTVSVGQIIEGFNAFYETYFDLLDISSSFKALQDNSIDTDLGCSPFWILTDFGLFDKLTDFDRDPVAQKKWIIDASKHDNIDTIEAEKRLRVYLDGLKQNKGYFCFKDLYGNE